MLYRESDAPTSKRSLRRVRIVLKRRKVSCGGNVLFILASPVWDDPPSLKLRKGKQKEAQHAPSPNITRNRGENTTNEAFCQRLWGIFTMSQNVCGTRWKFSRHGGNFSTLLFLGFYNALNRHHKRRSPESCFVGLCRFPHGLRRRSHFSF